jgi:hypothetical protein
VAAVACGIEVVAAGLLKPLGVAECGWMPGLGWGSALQILMPGAHPAGLDWCHPAGRMAGAFAPFLCCQVPQNHATASALALPIVRLY